MPNRLRISTYGNYSLPRVAEAYYLQFPGTLLNDRKDDLPDAVINVVQDTANIAFGPTRDGEVILGHQNLRLQQALHDMGVTHLADTHMVSAVRPVAMLGSSELRCVDKRLPQTDELEITHAGGALVLHPGLRDCIRSYHRRVLQANIEITSQTGHPISRIDQHVGVSGAKGCGMYNSLSGKYPRVREILNSPASVPDMLKKVRDAIGQFVSSDCKITSTTIDPLERAATYDLEDAAQLEAFLAAPDLKL